MASYGIVAGIAASVLLIAFAVLFFFQTKDPAILVFVTWPILVVWGVVFIVHLLRHGIPVRIVADERRRE